MKNKSSRSRARRARGASLAVNSSERQPNPQLANREAVAAAGVATLNTLQRLSRDITSSLNLEEVYQAIYRGAGELMDCDAFFISIYDPESKLVNFVFRVDQGKFIPPETFPLDNGMTSYVICNRVPVSVTNIAEERRFQLIQWGDWGDYKSLICAPMIVGNRVIGALSAQSGHVDAYDQAKMEILATFAAQAAIAIQNGQLFADSQRKMGQLAVLNEVGRIVSSTIDIDRLLDLIYEQVRRILPTDTYYVTLIDYARQTQTIQVLVDDGVRYPPHQISLDEGLVSLVVKRRAPLLIRHLTKEDPQVGAKSVQIGKPQQSESWLGVPLMTPESLLGVLAIASYQVNAFDESDREILQNVATQAAIAIDNARLFAASQRRMKELAVLNEVGRIVGSTIEIDKLLELIYEQVRRIISADSYFVTLADFERRIRTVALLVDEGERFPPREFPLEQGLAGAVIKKRAPLLVRNLEEEKLQSGIQPVHLGKPRLSQSWLGVPMMTSGHLLGTLAVASYHANAFDENDLGILQSVATQAAIAVDNARHHAQVEDQARRDSLTQVLNHGYFVQSLQEEINRAEPEKESLALIMLDVDHFKEYNDRYGHLAGDAILRGTVQAIRQNVKQTDLIGRWGGEEFAIALKGSNSDQACAVAERIRKLLPQMKLSDDRGRPVPTPTVSQGIAVYPQDAVEAFALVDVADRRLYQAKERGRDQIQC